MIKRFANSFLSSVLDLNMLTNKSASSLKDEFTLIGNFQYHLLIEEIA
ncbi:MAG: hypothetical protein AB9846_03010 [Tenuifilaceae bacterium]